MPAIFNAIEDAPIIFRWPRRLGSSKQAPSLSPLRETCQNRSTFGELVISSGDCRIVAVYRFLGSAYSPVWQLDNC
jgi:hypothetical protein